MSCMFFQCSDLGFHQSISQVFQRYLSRRLQAHQNLGCGLQQLESAQSGLDQNQDRDALMQAHETTFCLPLRFQYQPHEGDQVLCFFSNQYLVTIAYKSGTVYFVVVRLRLYSE